MQGASGIDRLPDDLVAGLSAKVGGRVPDTDDDPEGFDPDTVMSPQDQCKVDRSCGSKIGLMRSVAR